MDERLKELLGRIVDLAEEELVELRDLILQQFDEFSATADEDNPVSIEVLASLADAADALTQERKRRAGLAKRTGSARQVLASFRAEARGGRLVVPEGRGPRPGSYGGSATAVTAGGVPIPDKSDLAEHFVTAINNRQLATGGDGRIPIATVRAAVSSRGALLNTDPMAATLAITAAAEEHAHEVSASLREFRENPNAQPAVAALTAAGGFGAPEETVYGLPGFEVADRPVKAALPTFTTSRGGVRFMRGPELASMAGAIGIWDVADDVAAVAPDGPRKPSLRVLPGGEIVVNTQAITNILTFGNLTGRAYPEWVERVVDLANVAHARLAEQQLLTQMGALSTAVTGAVDEGAGLGATRVLLPLVDRAATGMRNRLRMRADAPLQLILPDWARGILRSDLALQEPGDATLGVTDGELVQYLATRNVAPTWAMDGEAGQQFNPQAPGPVAAWPTEVIAYMFPAGAFQFLDGGTLNLGLVRDSTLNAANDFQMFSEAFEGVLFRGGEAFRLTQPVTPSGIARAAA